MSAPVCVPDAAADQRQILRDLAAEYGRQLREILQVGDLIKGSVYQIQTRCGNPGCHCAMPRCFPGVKPAERACARWAWTSATASAACPSSTAACGRRAPMWSGCTNRCCTPLI